MRDLYGLRYASATFARTFLYIGGVELDALAGFDTSLQGGGSGPVQESTRLGDIVRRSGPRAHGSPVSMRSWRGTACPARRASA